MKTTPSRRPSRNRSHPRKTSRWVNSAMQVNIHAAKTHLSRLLCRVEDGESITIARDGRAIAIVSPAPSAKRRPPLSSDDSLLNLSKYTFKGPGGVLTNEEIDRIVYGV